MSTANAVHSEAYKIPPIRIPPLSYRSSPAAPIAFNSHRASCVPLPASRVAGQRRKRRRSSSSPGPSPDTAFDADAAYQAKKAEIKTNTSFTAAQKRKLMKAADHYRRKAKKRHSKGQFSKKHGADLLYSATDSPRGFVNITDLFLEPDDIRWIGPTGKGKDEIRERLEAAFSRMAQLGYIDTTTGSAYVRNSAEAAREFTYIVNDEMHVTKSGNFAALTDIARVAQLITDADGRILVVKVRPPSEPWYWNAVEGATEQLHKLHEALGPVPKKDGKCGRGTEEFTSVNFGFSFGGGQVVCLTDHCVHSMSNLIAGSENDEPFRTQPQGIT